MKRDFVATLVLLHGLAHASAGVWAASEGPAYLVTPLWGVAMLGYIAAGLGLFRVPVLRMRWKELMLAATIASIVLLMLYTELVGLVGAAIDVVLLLVVFGWAQREADAGVDVAEIAGADALPHPVVHRIAWAIGAAFLVYATAVVVIRPVYLRWGTTPNERVAALLGDERVPDARYRVDHAITIDAPADSVWPWLVQLGQDRGGFYSYSWLERMIGDDIRNADAINPEWQRRAVGDTVWATQPGYLGGRHVGWRVADMEPRRALYLENWGAFVLIPIDASHTRLIVRSRGPATPNLLMVALSPINVFVFEPAHFIMQRGMLRGIKQRAERRSVGHVAGLGPR